MVIERWTANPPEDFLLHMELWIRIRHIPVNMFTTDTMFALAKEICKVEEIAYDPKISHTKDYILAKVIFNVNNPAKDARKLTVSKESTVTIGFEYEKIHKRCFHCLRLTHEKIRCPFVRKEASSSKSNLIISRSLNVAPIPTATLEGPPGFPVLFPELSKEDRKLALLYISHADETERNARILRVQQGIDENKTESSIRLTKITTALDKGKGHVFQYNEQMDDSLFISDSHHRAKAHLTIKDKEDKDTESSASYSSACSEPVLPTGFRLGPSSEGRVSGNQGMSKASRKRPSSWKRKAFSKSNASVCPQVPLIASNVGSSKRKPSPLVPSENKSFKVSDSMVASVLKPLQPQ